MQPNDPFDLNLLKTLLTVPSQEKHVASDSLDMTKEEVDYLLSKHDQKSLEEQRDYIARMIITVKVLHDTRRAYKTWILKILDTPNLPADVKAAFLAMAPACIKEEFKDA